MSNIVYMVLKDERIVEKVFRKEENAIQYCENNEDCSYYTEWEERFNKFND